METEYYGTDIDTYVKTSKGLFLLNPESEAKYEDHTIWGLPDDAVKLSPGITYDTEIPEEIL
jgi:hypothetical protein